MLLSDIGVGSNFLFCLTNTADCCTTGRGGWRFPTDKNTSLTLNYEEIRGIGFILLNRSDHAMDPEATGIFTCRIPTNQSVDNTNLYIGVYDDAGEGVLGIHCCCS